MSLIIQELKEKISGKGLKVVFPESNDPRIIEAAVKLAEEGIVKPILVQTKDPIASGYDISKCTVIDPKSYDQFDKMVEAFVARRNGKATKEQAQEWLLDENYFGTMLVYMGQADGMVSGACHSTGETVRPALQIIKTKPGVSRTFGYFLMVRDNDKYIFGDCAINPNPTAEHLAEFAIESAKAAEMFGITPKVAMLSFSTNGSAETEETEKVRQATALAQQANSGYEIDGEMQFDAAFVPSVGAKKYPGSTVAGQANTFIFPDLNSGNIGYKIAQRLGQFEAMGPILAGLNSPVNDLSRGCDSEDAYNTAIITAAQALNK
ncbi:phosphate acetyltransferase [Candidatus Xianfuyuplasma coldseepsis]|uniref:Phosphate acetyltransferase n=1 Tax=Candidatus Xianfuyuplasma coldseepsis TaxID=2782163 RepID=A0A7L7KRY2_9MOLU|nr:phosphate acetyltransferase [Xianfuyuplasma coldseepsis]QMS84956.1 phosphate acetyltransferase [Xianfuyuplasma coldseepsis]